MRFNTTLTIKSNGKFDISMLIAMVNLAESETAITEEQKQEYERQGWEVEEYNQDNYLGVILRKYDLTPEDVEESVESTNTSVSDGAGDFSFTKEGLKYVIDWKLNPESSASGGETNDPDKYAQYFEQLGGFMTLGINLPVKPIASNATSVSDDGKSLEWDLLKLDKEMTIHVEFMLINIWLLIALIAVGIAVIAAIVIAIVLVSKKKKIPTVSSASTWSGDSGWGSGDDLNLNIENAPGTAANTAQAVTNTVNEAVQTADSTCRFRSVGSEIRSLTA